MSKFALSSGIALIAVLAIAPSVRAQGIPDEATAKCRDGTWSVAQHSKGACAGHKGVLRWTGRRPTTAYARCNDGSYWTHSAAKGACSRHGGVLASYRHDERVDNGAVMRDKDPRHP
jgi:hypothetical protein